MSAAISPQEGANIMLTGLDNAEALVEYEYTPADPGRVSGPPENCYPPTDSEINLLGVHINGVWCDVEGVFADAVIDLWRQQVEDREQERRESDMAERDEMKREYS